ncbi:MAG: arginyltransferase [Candidatus Pacebacteria bacterium]|nr:arginyltransferase [Candidatus Paceibacterota bacterium]
MTDKSLLNLASLDDSLASMEWLRWVFGELPSTVKLSIGEQQIRALVSNDYPCAYFAGQRERRLLVDLLTEAEPQKTLDSLTEQGFRRNGNHLYRPNCPNCSACISVRVVAARFKPNRTQHKIINRNRDLRLAVKPNLATVEHYRLFRDYQDHRHPDGTMSDMNWADYKQMIESSHIATQLYELRYGSGGLAGVCIVDPMGDGLSAVYSFFDVGGSADDSPTPKGERSLGSYMILSLIDAVARLGKSYLYLGYWIADSPKMSYKSRYSGLETFTDGQWREFLLAAQAKIP